MPTGCRNQSALKHRVSSNGHLRKALDHSCIRNCTFLPSPTVILTYVLTYVTAEMAGAFEGWTLITATAAAPSICTPFARLLRRHYRNYRCALETCDNIIVTLGTSHCAAARTACWGRHREAPSSASATHDPAVPVPGRQYEDDAKA